MSPHGRTRGLIGFMTQLRSCLNPEDRMERCKSPATSLSQSNVSLSFLT